MQYFPAMDRRDRRTAMEAAGRWLREERERRHIKGGEFARTIGIDPSQLSRYERGMSAVPDDRAQQIAEALGADLIAVRRNLGLWVPRDDEHEEGDEAARTEDDLDANEQLIMSMTISDEEKRFHLKAYRTNRALKLEEERPDQRGA